MHPPRLPDAPLGLIAAQLRARGYETAHLPHDDERLDARHPSMPSLTLCGYAGGVLVTATLATTDFAKQNRPMLDHFCGLCNRGATVSRFYPDPDLDLTVEAFYAGPYHPLAFELLVDGLMAEARRLPHKHLDLARRLFDL